MLMAPSLAPGPSHTGTGGLKTVTDLTISMGMVDRSTLPYWLEFSGRPLSSTRTPPALPDPRMEIRDPIPALGLTSTPAMLLSVSSTLRKLRSRISWRSTVVTCWGWFCIKSVNFSAVTVMASRVTGVDRSWIWAS